MTIRKHKRWWAMPLLAALALPAGAVNLDWGPHDSFESAVVDVPSSGGADVFGFTLAGTKTLLAGLDVGNGPGVAAALRGTVALFQDLMGPDVEVGSFEFGPSAKNGSHTFDDLGAGAYYYLVSSDTPSQVGGRFTIASSIDGPVTSPVPEPQVALLLMAGLGCVGVMARRRKPGR